MCSDQSLSGELLAQWVASVLNEPLVSLTPLSGDAGFRQYFRVDSVPSLLAVMAPHTDGISESAAWFSHISQALRQSGIPAPEIIDFDEQKNYLLQEDFGSCSLLDRLVAGGLPEADSLYGESLMVLLRLQQQPASLLELSAYDTVLLSRELEVFTEWFLGHLLEYELSDNEKVMIQNMFSFLIQKALEQPQVIVHRDYHSRNLMYREGQAPGVIDFQDAVIGPVTYDLVSLLRDCYIRWPIEQVKSWVLGYGNMAYAAGVVPIISEKQWLEWFDTMGLQRHIKVLGVFARLSLRDGKHGYLQDLPLVLRYVLEVAEVYPQTQDFADWVKGLLPLMEKQSWYKPWELAGDYQ